MNVLTIIPARGGSKSVPRKNIKEICGKPLIAWTIEEAKLSKHGGRIIVSTDDEEIAGVARKFGAEVPFMRPKEISQDLSTDLEFVLHALDWFEKNESYVPQAVMRLSPTTPLRTAQHIDKMVELLERFPEAHSVRPVSKVSHHPFKTWKVEGDTLIPFFQKEITGFDEPWNLPRQLFIEAYIGLGASGIAWTETFRKFNSTSGTKIKTFIMDEVDAFDINHPVDFIIAETLLRERLEGN